jgi:hypothetical protein
MQKTTTVLLGATLLVVTALVIWKGGPRAKAAPSLRPAASALAAPAPEPTAGDAGLGPAVAKANEALMQSLAPDAPGARLLDGTPPPALGPDAPKSARFGVVLVQYRGAQRAPANARSKQEALAMAQSLAELARNDFKAAVEKGDGGSAENLGRIGAGVLEPAPNYILFSLPPAGVGGPVDTPTGYWIIRNLGK